jgi:acetyl esterase/lipase
MSSVVRRSLASTHLDDPDDLAPMARIDADMHHVLSKWRMLEPKPVAQCTPAEARAQPTLMTALARVLHDRPGDRAVSMEMRMIPTEHGDIRARVYAPIAVTGIRRPMILYFHGGLFVLGDLDRDEETPLALARKCDAIVVAAHYRLAPEFKFPAAHEDAAAAWRWMIGNADNLGGDLGRVAIVGEDAGANLAANLALDARDTQGTRPRHVALVAPMADTDFSAASYLVHADSEPLDAATVRWAYHRLMRSEDTLNDKRLRLIDRDFTGMPPVTLINAAIDPLLSEGQALADALRRSGVWVDATVYDGVTAQFLGLARIVNKAMFAQGQIVRNLTESFARGA